jgi:2-C-methyl-D-erythritol 2,4-cyclodiphosphate synthase
MQPSQAADESRVGFGHDIHRLVAGGNLVLGGVTIDDAAAGFDTHSDGDVLCHALVDALAGALADGDLGTHFPEDDPDSADARSLGFVEQFAETVRAAGMAVANIDSFIVLGTTRLRPHIEQMRTNLATALGVDLDRVSVKSRSNDGIGPEGEGTAASASVIVLLRRLSTGP